MFLVGQLGATIDGDAGPFMKELDRVSREGGRRMQQVGRTMTAALTAPLVGAGGLALKTAADYETLRQSMDVLNGSAEEGARNFERLKEFSSRTPFQLKDLSKAQNTLQGFSLSADDAFESMSMIGDIAAVTGGDVQAISVAFGQAAAEGKLLTRDIRQLINQGVPAVQMLADSMNVATSEVFDLASQGEITFEVLQKAFREATSEGGRFANGMEKQSKTLAGTFSTLKDNASIALAEIGTSLEEAFDIKELMRGLTDGLRSATEWFSQLSDGSKQLAFMVGGVTAAVGPLSLALGTVMRMLPTLISGFKKLRAVLVTNPWYAIGAAVAFVGTRAVIARKSLNALKESISDVVDEGDNLDAVNAKIAELGERFSEAAKVAATIPGTEAEDIVDPELLVQLDKLVALQRELSQEKIQMRIDRRDVDELAGFMNMMNINLTELENKDPLAGFDMSTPFVEAQQPMDKVISNMGELDSMVKSIDVSVPDKYFPPGSLGAIKQKIQELRNSLQVATDPEDIQYLRNEIARLRGELNQTSSDGARGLSAMTGFANGLGNALAQAALHGKDLQSTLTGLLKQLASKAFVTGIGALLTGGASLGGKSFLSNVFGGFRANGGSAMAGSAYMVGESGPEMFVPSTNGSVQPIGSGTVTGGITKQEMSQVLGQHLQQLGPEELYMLTRKGQFSY